MGSHCQAHQSSNKKSHQLRIMMVPVIIVCLFFILTLSGYMPPKPQSGVAWQWVLIGVIILIACTYSGQSLYSSAWSALKKRRANMGTLVTLGITAAWSYSMSVAIFPQYFPELARHLYFDTPILLLCFVNIGAFLESRANQKTTDAIDQLKQLAPTTATVMRDNQVMILNLADIQSSDVLMLRAGDRVPLDGVILQGECAVDASMLTGESLPMDKKIHDTVMTGTVLVSGSVRVRITAMPDDTVLSNIIEIVRQAQKNASAVSPLVDKISAVFSPLVLLIAFVTALAWYLLGPAPQIAYSLTTAISVLVIACPCVLGMATPISIAVGVGFAARLGVLIKHSKVIQAIQSLDTIIFDKTGTLTTGELVLTSIISCQAYSQAALLDIAASMELVANHPIAKAVLRACASDWQPLKSIVAIETIPGNGLRARGGEDTYLLGSRQCLLDHDVSLAASEDRAAIKSSSLSSLIYLAKNDQLIGIMSFEDTVRQGSAEAIAELAKRGYQTVLLSGDHPIVAETVAKSVGIETVIASVKPDEKAAVVLQYQEKGQCVAMVGDGINDAPALTTANVGIAMGAGADIALSSAEVVLMGSDIRQVITFIDVSKKIINTIRQNLWGAFAYNAIGITIAAGAIYPITGHLLSPVFAGAAMAMSSLTVVLNALRLNRVSLSLWHRKKQ